MDQVLEHLRANMTGYIILGVCLVPLLFLTRKYSIPLLMYAVEITIYFVIMHVVVWLFVGVTRWFKESSSMRALREDGVPEGAPDWSTPLVEFWDKAQYNPEWVAWVEIVLAIIVVALVIKLRPLKIQRKTTRDWRASGNKTKAYDPRKYAPTPLTAKPGLSSKGRAGKK